MFLKIVRYFPPNWAKAHLIKGFIIATTLRSWLLKLNDERALAKIEKKIPKNFLKNLYNLRQNKRNIS